MEYYLLSEQDIYEIKLEFENLFYEILELIKSKKVEEDEGD